MIVRDLIKLLEKEDPERLVVCQGDPEGNFFSELEDIESMAYDSRNNEVGYEELTEELRNEGFDEADVMENGIPSLILIPQN